jgi:hypothetical protein
LRQDSELIVLTTTWSGRLTAPCASVTTSEIVKLPGASMKSVGPDAGRVAEDAGAARRRTNDRPGVRQGVAVNVRRTRRHSA